jgi:hypothetical protein
MLAVVAVLAFGAGVASDVLDRHFWARHPLLAKLAASLIVVMLSVAPANEAVERRRRRRWRVLTQYVMLELVRHARMVWTGIIGLAGLTPSDDHAAASIDAGACAVRDTPRSRWAAVMLGADAYAQLIDRHVELARDVAWLGDLLDQFEPIDEDRGRQRMSQISPAVEIVGEFDDSKLADTVVRITQLAERLDRRTLELALRIVPAEWRAARHGRTAPLSSVGSGSPR